MLAGAGRKTRVHQVRGCSPLFLCNEAEIVSELSIFKELQALYFTVFGAFLIQNFLMQ